jgi:hypothetical protein
MADPQSDTPSGVPTRDEDTELANGKHSHGDASQTELEDAHALADPARDADAEGQSTGDQIGGQSSHSEEEIATEDGKSNHAESGRPNISDTNAGWGVAERDQL